MPFYLFLSQKDIFFFTFAEKFYPANLRYRRYLDYLEKLFLLMSIFEAERLFKLV